MVWAVLAIVGCAWAVVRLRRRVLPDGSALGLLVADAVVFVTALTTIGQVAGAVGALRGWTVLAAVAVLVFAGWRWGRPATPGEARFGGVRDAFAGTPRWELGVVLAALVAVAAQWGAHVGDAYARGMVQADNLWYHGPFVARMVQTGGFESFAPFGYPESRYFPLNAHVVDAMLVLPTGTDVLLPAVNLVYAALAVVAAAAIGQHRGAAAPATLAVLLPLSLPVIASTQPGQMYNDLAAAGLVLAAFAVLGDGRPTVARATIAGLALGWALSTKLTVATVVVAIAVGVALLLRRRADRSALWAGAVAFGVTGSVWFVRNALVSGSPIPYTDLRIGPIGFEQRVTTEGRSLVGSLPDLSEFGRYYLESLDISLGPLWPVVLVLAAAGTGAAFIVERPVERLVGATAGLGLMAFPFLPLTGGLPFVNNLRYALAPLILGVLGLVLVTGRTRWRAVVVGASSVVIVANLLSSQRGRVPAWPDQPGWIAVGVVGAVVAATSPWWAADLASRLAGVGRARRAGSAVGAAAAVVVTLAAVVAVAFGEDDYLRARYIDGSIGHAAVYGVVAGSDDARVDAVGFIETYAFFGAHLSNDVHLWNEALPRLDVAASPCREVFGWFAGDPPGDGSDRVRLVAVGDAWLYPTITAEQQAAWFGADPAFRLVAGDANEAVYELSGPPDPTTCPA